jgi:hypothetical protein
MGYALLAMIPGSEQISIGQLSEQLRKKFAPDPDAKVSVQPKTAFQGEHVRISWGEWGFRVNLAEGPNVLAESREIAEQFGKQRPDRDRLALSRRRVEVASDDDVDMDHFNDYIFIAELLEELHRAILFEPEGGTFMDEK